MKRRWPIYPIDNQAWQVANQNYVKQVLSSSTFTLKNTFELQWFSAVKYTLESVCWSAVSPMPNPRQIWFDLWELWRDHIQGPPSAPFCCESHRTGCCVDLSPHPGRHSPRLRWVTAVWLFCLGSLFLLPLSFFLSIRNRRTTFYLQAKGLFH